MAGLGLGFDFTCFLITRNLAWSGEKKVRKVRGERGVGGEGEVWSTILINKILFLLLFYTRAIFKTCRKRLHCASLERRALQERG